LAARTILYGGTAENQVMNDGNLNKRIIKETRIDLLNTFFILKQLFCL